MDAQQKLEFNHDLLEIPYAKEGSVTTPTGETGWTMEDVHKQQAADPEIQRMLQAHSENYTAENVESADMSQ